MTVPREGRRFISAKGMTRFRQNSQRFARLKTYTLSAVLCCFLGLSAFASEIEIFPMLIIGSNAPRPPVSYKVEPVKSKEILANLDFANWENHWEIEPKEQEVRRLIRGKPLKIDFAKKKYRIALFDLGGGRVQVQVTTPTGRTYSKPAKFQKNRIIVAGKQDGMGWFLYIHKGKKRPK